MITGRFKGFALKQPRSNTRPTTDRTKEALFSRLESYGMLNETCVLDLFAGTGALGIEALSRGAQELVAVEANTNSAQLIAATFNELKTKSAWNSSMKLRIVRAKAERYAAKAQLDDPSKPFDLVLIDPPYAWPSSECNELLATLTERDLVADFGMIVLERSTRTAQPQPPKGWYIDDRRDYGETAVYFLRSDAYREAITN